MKHCSLLSFDPAVCSEGAQVPTMTGQSLVKLFQLPLLPLGVLPRTLMLFWWRMWPIRHWCCFGGGCDLSDTDAVLGEDVTYQTQGKSVFLVARRDQGSCINMHKNCFTVYIWLTVSLLSLINRLQLINLQLKANLFKVKFQHFLSIQPGP